MTYLFLHPIMHLLLFLSPDWLTFCHMTISLIYIHSFLSDEGPMLETLDYTFRIGSTPTFLYFDFVSLLCLRSTLRLLRVRLESTCKPRKGLGLLPQFLLRSCRSSYRVTIFHGRTERLSLQCNSGFTQES